MANGKWCLVKSQMMFDKISNLKWQMSFAQNFKSQMANGKWQMVFGQSSIGLWSRTKSSANDALCDSTIYIT